MRRRESSGLLLHLLLAACVVASAACGAGWRRAELGPQTRLAPRQQVQVWTADGGSHVLHALAIDSTHVSGVPYHLSPECDSCRVQLPRGDVDSIRLGSKTKGFVRSLGFGYMGSIAFLLAALRWM